MLGTIRKPESELSEPGKRLWQAEGGDQNWQTGTHPSGSSWESLSEVHSSPMSGKVKNRVLGTGPGAIHTLGSRSPGAGSWQGFRGLEAALLLLPKGMLTEGRVLQTAPGLGKATEATEPAEPL